MLYLSISNRGINELEHSGIQGGVDTERGLLALARELQTSLYYIAREAELGSKDALQVISDSAEYALRLIDSYLIASQVERGQLHLNLEPVALGSVLHDTKYALATSLHTDISIHIQNKASLPIMTQKDVLRSALVASGMLIAEATTNNKTVVLRSFTTRSGDIGAGVFARDINLSKRELEYALSNSGRPHMALPKYSGSTGISLSIADSLCRALGGRLEVKQLGRFTGLSTLLPKSEQLAII